MNYGIHFGVEVFLNLIDRDHERILSYFTNSGFGRLSTMVIILF